MDQVVSMECDPERIPRRKEPLNLVTGVFLKSVHFLNPDLSKCLIVGIFKNRGDSLGVGFKGKRGCVYWSYDAFNQFAVFFDEITQAFEKNIKTYLKLDTGEDIKVVNVFGKQHVFLYDGEHSLNLTCTEFAQFIDCLPLVHSRIKQLFMFEDLIKEYIRDSICSPEADIPTHLPIELANTLLEEVLLYKHASGC